MAPEQSSGSRPASLFQKLRQLSDRRRRNPRLKPSDPQPDFDITHYPDRPRRPAESPPDEELIDWFVNIHLQANRAVMAERSRQLAPVGRYDLSAPHLYQPPVLTMDKSCDCTRPNPSGPRLTPNRSAGVTSELLSSGPPHLQGRTAPKTALERPPRNHHQLKPAQPSMSPTFLSFTPSPDSCYSSDKSEVADVLRLYRFEAAKRGSCLICQTHRHATITPGTFYCTSCKRDFNCYPPRDVFIGHPVIAPKPLAERRILKPGEGTERVGRNGTGQKPPALPPPRYASHMEKVAFVDPSFTPLADPEPEGDAAEDDDDPFSRLRSEIDTAIQKINPIATIRSHGLGPMSAVRAVGGLRGARYGEEIVDLGDVRRQVRFRREAEASSGSNRDSGLGDDIARCDIRVVKDGCDVRSNSWELDFLEQYEWERGNGSSWK